MIWELTFATGLAAFAAASTPPRNTTGWRKKKDEMATRIAGFMAVTAEDRTRAAIGFGFSVSRV